MQKDLKIEEFEDIFQPCSANELQERGTTLFQSLITATYLSTPVIPSPFFSLMLNQRQTTATEVRMRMLESVSRQPKINVCGMWGSINEL